MGTSKTNILNTPAKIRYKDERKETEDADKVKIKKH